VSSSSFEMINMSKPVYALEIEFMREYSKRLFFFRKRMTSKDLQMI